MTARAPIIEFSPTCVPARVAMFTGKSPELHGRYGYREGISFPEAYPVTRTPPRSAQ